MSAEGNQGMAKLGNWTRIGYSSGNLGKSIQRSALDLLYLFFLVEIIGLSAWSAGLIIFLILVWDSLTDPILAFYIDRLRSRPFYYQRLILWAAPPSALLFVLIFALPLLWDDFAIPLAIIVGILFHAAFTIVDVPHNALLADITRDSRERGVLSAMRFFFSSLGTLMVAFLFVPVIDSTTLSEPSALITISVAAASFYAIIMSISAIAAKSIQPTSSNQSRQPVDLPTALRALMTNRRLLIMLSVFALSAALITIFSRMTLFYSNSWLGSTDFATSLVASHAAGQIVSLPLWSSISARTEKRTAALFAHGLFAMVMVAFLFLSPKTIMFASILFFFAGFSLSGLTVMNWAIIPDTVEYTEHGSGARHEALTFGVLLFVIKLSAGIGAALLGAITSFSGYDSTSNMAGDELPGLILGMTLPGFIGSLLCIVLLKSIRLSHADHEEIQSM